MAVGQKLKELRTSNKLTQSELAERIGTSQRSISQWELGGRDIKTSILIKVSELFDVSMDYFKE